MRRRYRLLVVSAGAAAAALGLSGAALADPSPPAPSASPSGSASVPASPVPASPVPSASAPGASAGTPAPVTSTSAGPDPSRTTGTPTAPSAGAEAGDDGPMGLGASDLVLSAHGPGTYSGQVHVWVRNYGTDVRQGLQVSVVAPKDFTIVSEDGGDGIGDCTPTSTSDGRDGLACQVTDRGKGKIESIDVTLRGSVPLPQGGASGRVLLQVTGGGRTTTLNTVGFDVTVDDESLPKQEVRFDRSFDDPTRLALGEDGRYHGSLRLRLGMHSDQPVDRVTVEVTPPANVTIAATGDLTDCEPISGGRDWYPFPMPDGLRCSVPLTQPDSDGSFTFALTATTPDTKGTLGVTYLSAEKAGVTITYPDHRNTANFHVAFDGTSEGTGGGSGAGSGSGAASGGLPVTGSSLSLLAGSGAALLAAGAALLVLLRRRRA